MTQLGEALKRVGAHVTDWDRVRTSEPVDRQASKGIGGADQEASPPQTYRSTQDATLDELAAEREALLREKESNLREIGRLRERIRLAQGRARGGQYADTAWYASTERAIKDAGVRDQSLANRLSELKRVIGDRRREVVTVNDDADPVALLKLALDHIYRAVELLGQKDRSR